MLKNLLLPELDADLTALLQAVSRADQKAFSQLVQAYWNKIYGQALAYTKSPMLAQEIVQDVFVKVWNNRDQLPDIVNFSNYLFILSRNQIISAMRKSLTETKAANSSNVEEDLILADAQLQYKETYSLILKGIELLPPTRKRIFKMSRLDGLSHEEIAAVLELSKSTVKGHIVLALNFLRTYLHTHTGPFIAFILLLANR